MVRLEFGAMLFSVNYASLGAAWQALHASLRSAPRSSRRPRTDQGLDGRPRLRDEPVAAGPKKRLEFGSQEGGHAGCVTAHKPLRHAKQDYLTGHDYSSAPSYIPAGHLQICHQALVVVDTVVVVDEVLVVVDVVDDVEVLVWLVEVVVVVV